MTQPERFRSERDSMGEFDVPIDAYYGANTMRARLNFPISDLRFNRSFIEAIASIKLAAAQVNHELGALDAEQSDAIVAAAREVADGDFDDQFVVDIFQTGSGTSTNMNANEVISNRAIEMLGGVKGSRDPDTPERSRQSGPVVERCHTDGDTRRRPARDSLRPDTRARRAAGRPQSEGRRIHARPEDRQNALCRTPRPFVWARSSWATRDRWSAA